ncbi:hypothetical protein GCM10027592_02830 [Spirosoma flavus]
MESIESIIAVSHSNEPLYYFVIYTASKLYDTVHVQGDYLIDKAAPAKPDKFDMDKPPVNPTR